MRKGTGGRTFARDTRLAPAPRFRAAPALPITRTTPARPRWWRWALLPVLILLCPPLALALHGRLFLGLVTGGALAALRIWYVPELLPLSAVVWALLGSATPGQAPTICSNAVWCNPLAARSSATAAR